MAVLPSEPEGTAPACGHMALPVSSFAYACAAVTRTWAGPLLNSAATRRWARRGKGQSRHLRDFRRVGCVGQLGNITV